MTLSDAEPVTVSLSLSTLTSTKVSPICSKASRLVRSSNISPGSLTLTVRTPDAAIPCSDAVTSLLPGPTASTRAQIVDHGYGIIERQVIEVTRSGCQAHGHILTVDLVGHLAAGDREGITDETILGGGGNGWPRDLLTMPGFRFT